MKKRIIIRKPAEGKDNASRGQHSGFSAQAEENYDASRGEHCEEIDNASREDQNVFPPRAEESDNESQKPEEIFKDRGPYSRPRSLDKTNKKDIDGPVLSLDRGCPPEKKKLQRSLWVNDNDTESTYEQIGSIIDDEEWLEALRFRLDQSEEERRNRNQDGKEENDSAVEESEERKERRREILQVLEKRQQDKDVAKAILNLRTASCGEESTNWIVEVLYGIKNDDGLLTFEQKMARRMFTGDRWKRTDVVFKTGGISQSFEAKKPGAITHISHTDEHRHQSSASDPRNRGEQPISRPSKERYSYLPHFHEELGNFKAVHSGDSEQVEGFLIGRKEKLQEIRRELGSRSRARSPDEIHEREVVDDSVISLCSELSSDSRSRSLDNIHEKEVMDGEVSSPGYSPSPEKNKLLTLWDVDIYEEDVGNSPEDVEPSKPMLGSADDQDA